MEGFDWQKAIERNRAALLRIVAVLFVYAGLDGGGADVVPRRVWRRIVRLLRPAEAAARRLIVIAARGIEVAPPRPRAGNPPTAIGRLQAAGLLVIHRGIDLGLARAWRPQDAEAPKSAPGLPAFRLTDSPRRFDTKAWEGLRPFPQDGFVLADADDDVCARHLCRRILSLKAALDDLPGQAKRLARWKARQERLPAGKRRFSPIRRGWPPGRRRRPIHAVDDILADLHGLAVHALGPDSS
ncbi:MAG: hypothetical protein Kow0026_25740 [Oricola sp.]